MKLVFTGYTDDDEIKVSVPIEDVIKSFWKESVSPNTMTVSTEAGTEHARAEFVLDETAPSHQAISISTEDEEACRLCSWFRLELPTNGRKTCGYLYGGNTTTEPHSIAVIVDGIRSENDDSRRVLWVKKENTHIESWNNAFNKYNGAITEEQLTELINTENSLKFNFDAYAKRLTANPHNTLKYISGVITSKDKSEINLVVDSLNAMGVTAEVEYFDKSECSDEASELMEYYIAKVHI